MNPWIGIAIQFGGVLFTAGLTYGLLKGKIDNQAINQVETNRKIDKLIDGNVDFQRLEERQTALHNAIDEKFETVNDRLDVYDMGLKKAENDIVQLKAQISKG